MADLGTELARVMARDLAPEELVHLEPLRHRVNLDDGSPPGLAARVFFDGKPGMLIATDRSLCFVPVAETSPPVSIRLTDVATIATEGATAVAVTSARGTKAVLGNIAPPARPDTLATELDRRAAMARTTAGSGPTSGQAAAPAPPPDPITAPPPAPPPTSAPAPAPAAPPAAAPVPANLGTPGPPPLPPYPGPGTSPTGPGPGGPPPGPPPGSPPGPTVQLPTALLAKLLGAAVTLAVLAGVGFAYDKIFNKPSFAVGDCVTVEDRILDSDIHKSSCTSSSSGETVYRVVEVNDGDDAGCRQFVDIEFSHEPEDTTYCLNIYF